VDEKFVTVQKRSDSLERKGLRRRSNRAKYPMTKIQLGAEILIWEQKEKVGSVENYS